VARVAARTSDSHSRQTNSEAAASHLRTEPGLYKDSPTTSNPRILKAALHFRFLFMRDPARPWQAFDDPLSSLDADDDGSPFGRSCHRDEVSPRKTSIGCHAGRVPFY
jgi:hypothetical protein